jgi:hypothetical protein
MPNWVSNTINIKGPTEELLRFQDHINIKPEYYQEEDYGGFSFHSFITLPEGTDKEEYIGSDGAIRGQHANTISPNHWYTWNINNWQTKWDACDVEVVSSVHAFTNNVSTIYVSFTTAWSPPDPIWRAMSEMFPELIFAVWYEEEQGWGGEFTIQNQVITDWNTWDIPSSHADYMAQNKECPCSYEDDEDYWYEDCPGKYKTVYTVEVITKMYVIANSEEDAIEVAKAEESGYNLPAYTEVKKVLYSDEYRVTEAVKQEKEN